MILMITALHMVEDMSISFSLWGGHLWNPSYCAVTVSDRSRAQVMQYIESQKDRS